MAEVGATHTRRTARFVRRIQVPLIVLFVIILLVVVALSFTFGRYDMTLGSLFSSLSAYVGGEAEGEQTLALRVFFNMRAPRILIAVLVGAALSSAGCAYQGIFKNPMVSPDLLGASAGACFGAALGILFSFGNAGIEILAFVMGIVAVCASCLMSSAISKSLTGVLVLVLSGIVVGNLFQAFVSAVKFVADPNSQLPDITFWLMGGLSAVRSSDLWWLLAAFVIGFSGLMVLRWKMNVMAFGDEEALSLGVEPKKTRRWVILFATLLTSASVAVSGMVGWVGLIIPHLARFLVGPDQRVLLPASALLGGSFLLLVDDICRSIYTTEIPLSIVTAIIGAPLFVYIICKQRRSQ